MAENIETRISSEHAKEAIYKINKLSEKGMTPDEIAAAVEKASELVGQDLVTQAELTTAIEGIDVSSLIYPNTFVLDGDSIGYQNSYDSSLTKHNSSSGFFTWGNFFLGGVMELMKNNSVGGERTTQLLARLQASIDLKPKFIYINIGANDLAGEVASSTIKSNLLEIATRITDAGIICIFNTITPQESITTRILATYEINTYIKVLPSIINNVLVVDAYSSIVNPSTDLAFSLHTRDGVHPSTIGAYKMGIEFAKTIDKYLTPVSLFSGGNGDTVHNIIPNAYMLGGTDTATGWTINVLSGSATKSKINRDNGLSFQQINCSTLCEFEMKQLITTNINSGDILKMVAEIEIDDAIVTLDYISIKMKYLTSAGVFLSESVGFNIDPTSTFRFPNNNISGIITSAYNTIPSTCGMIQFVIYGKALGKVRIGRCRTIKY